MATRPSTYCNAPGKVAIEADDNYFSCIQSLVSSPHHSSKSGWGGSPEQLIEKQQFLNVKKKNLSSRIFFFLLTIVFWRKKKILAFWILYRRPFDIHTVILCCFARGILHCDPTCGLRRLTVHICMPSKSALSDICGDVGWSSVLFHFRLRSAVFLSLPFVFLFFRLCCRFCKILYHDQNKNS